MKIALGSDHAGVKQKAMIKAWLEENGYDTLDHGPFTEDSVDYPDFAQKVAKSVVSKEADQGILLCGSGVGVSLAANKVKGIRAALVYNPEIASLARQHNNANIMCFPARFMNESDMKTCLTNWFNSSFEGGRHERRVSKLETV